MLFFTRLVAVVSLAHSLVTTRLRSLEMCQETTLISSSHRCLQIPRITVSRMANGE